MLNIKLIKINKIRLVDNKLIKRNIIRNDDNKRKLYIHFFYKIKIILFYSIFLFLIKDKKIILKTKYRSQTSICICAIGKKENLYIKEFVNHYKKLGYNHIYLYDNNDINDERFEDVIQNEINQDFVSIINYRGYRGRGNPQIESYYDCYEKNNKNYSWLSFYDIDEYLEIKPNTLLIQEFLDNERYKKCQNIKINWMVFSDNNLIYYENKSILERFTSKTFNDFENRHIKSTVRGNLSYNYWKKSGTPHAALDKKFIACGSSGNITNPEDYYHIYPPDYTNAILKHYPTKSLEEFYIKLERGKATRSFPINRQNIINMFVYYFSINNKTKQKLELINKKYNIDFK